MFYRILDENNVSLCPKNGTINGKYISNLAEYFESHKEIAKKEGYYPLVASEKPDIDSTQQYLEPIYIQNPNNIRQEWRIKNIEEVIVNEDE